MDRTGSWRWRNVSVFLAAFLFSLPGAVTLVHRIIELAPLPYEELRNRVIGEWYASLRAHEKTLPPGDVSVLLVGPQAIDRGIFVNYHLYPRASHLYFGKIPAAEPRRPLLVVERHGLVRRTIGRLQLSREAHREFLVPIVTAFHGADGYASEGLIASSRETRVTLTLMPSGAVRTYVVRPGQPLLFGDVVHDAFGVMATGWLRVRAEHPVRAAFSFLNRGHAIAAPVPIVTQLPPLPHRFANGEKLWVLNPGMVPVTVRNEVIEPGALRMFDGGTSLEVEASAPVLAFTSTKTKDGNTSFLWPEGLR
jgi:hypothetical protein